jgi:hypothetical protein
MSTWVVGPGNQALKNRTQLVHIFAIGREHPYIEKKINENASGKEVL